MDTDEPCLRYFNMGQWPCYVGFTIKQEEFDAEMKRLKVDDAPQWLNPGAAATTHFLGKYDMLTIIVCMQRAPKRSREQIAALIAHEAVHVMQEMQEHFYKSGKFDDETQAYLVQYLVQNFLYEYNKPGKEMSRSNTPCA